MKNPFEVCNPDELTAFTQIVKGGDVDDIPESLKNSLMKKNILNDHLGFVTIPPIVITLWEKYQESLK